jgi:hypothetical protein
MDRNEGNRLTPAPPNEPRHIHALRTRRRLPHSSTSGARFAPTFRTALQHLGSAPLAALLVPVLLAGGVSLTCAAAAPPAAAAADDVPPLRFTDDSRLSQRVSITAWAEPLEDVLAQLSRETGVTLAFEGHDLGDQRVNVLLKEQPLERVQALLAETLDLYWRRDRKAPVYRYVLFQDVRSRKQEKEILSRARERFEEGVRRMVDSLKLKPEEIEKLRPLHRWWANHLVDPGRRRAIDLLGRLAPGRWERLITTGRIEIPYDQLTPALQDLVRQYVAVANEGRDRRDQERGTPGQHHIGDVTRSGGRVRITVFGGVPPGPDSSIDVGVTPAEGKPGGHGTSLGYTDAEQHLLQEEFLPPRFEKARHNPSEEQGPRVTVTWKEKPLRWETVLRSVAKAADCQVVSDSYLYYWWERNMDLPEATALRDLPLSAVLDRVSTAFFYAWRRAGDVYLFRQRNWFLEKQHNIPERDLRHWHAHLEARGRMALDDLAELALLSDRQIRMVSETEIPTDAVTGHRALLRLYGALSPLPRSRLESSGVRVRELTPAQVELLRAWKPAAEAEPDDRLRLMRERDAVMFCLEPEAGALQAERVPLERGHPPTGG